MTSAALTKASDLLSGASIVSVASWADNYRRDHPESGPWHYINIPLAESKIDMARDCPNGQCVLAQPQHFLSVLQEADADKAAKAEALKFVVHFVGDLHRSLHDEDNGDRGGNTRHVTFDGKPDNLHWVWDTGRGVGTEHHPAGEDGVGEREHRGLGAGGSQARSESGLW